MVAETVVVKTTTNCTDEYLIHVKTYISINIVLYWYMHMNAGINTNYIHEFTNTQTNTQTNTHTKHIQKHIQIYTYTCKCRYT